ncbi:DUF2637 domain-containing protein [Streptacidiphilus fuscans]|uniref:DUF2637 domain-containing protein n=1 Tax=Streptacidiphilus fuscans TaxID=2789292 RepID=A0A931B2Q5_9ACTN|nr:DUF2637 domain-containing protein [Streptacidiphilus fuscans]MBF9068182.1 DUF2637 domain-containing protein [Streptacidiphilus fuscans]
MNRWPKVTLVLGLLAVVGMAFRVSWHALRDVAHAIGADTVAADVYPLVVDGLMALALIAALILPEGRDRKFSLRVLAGYTVASLVLNYVHGLVPAIQSGGRVGLADWAPANWALVLLATSLPVGSIFFGSDLVAKVLHHKPESAASAQTLTNRSGSDLGKLADPDPLPSVDTAPATARPEPTPEPTEAPEPSTPASRPRRSTGAVPVAARAKRPTRTPDELLTEARELSADWSDDQLTADRLRAGLHTSAAKARTLRDALKAERAARPQLHSVPEPADDPDADEGAA